VATIDLDRPVVTTAVGYAEDRCGPPKRSCSC